MKSSTTKYQMKRILLLGLGSLAVTGLALADDPTSGYSELETMGQPKVEQAFTINPGFSYMSDADYSKSSLGKVSVWRFDVPARYTIKTAPGDLGIGAFYEYSEYDLDKLANTQDFDTLAFDLLWKSMINDDWGYFAYGAVGFSSSTHTSLSSGLTGTGGGGARYVWSKDLSLGLGVAVSTQMEDDPFVLPIIALDWQISDRWNLRTLNGATLTYDFSGDNKFLLDLSGRYQRRQFRLNEGTSLTETMITVELGATYNFTPHAGLRGFVGVGAGRNFEVRHNGEKVASEDVDAAPIIGVRALFTF